jgi:hypothetical protein
VRALFLSKRTKFPLDTIARCFLSQIAEPIGMGFCKLPLQTCSKTSESVEKLCSEQDFICLDFRGQILKLANFINLVYDVPKSPAGGCWQVVGILWVSFYFGKSVGQSVLSGSCVRRGCVHSLPHGREVSNES